MPDRTVVPLLSVLLVTTLASCATMPPAPSARAVVEQAPAAAAPNPDATPGQPQTDSETSLVIGYTQAPDTLYGFASSSSVLAHVLQFVQPGCVTLLDYTFQPVCFEELPSLANGGLISETVTVHPNEISSESPIMIDGALITDASSVPAPIQLPQLTARWTIRDGITWDDGTPLTTDDFVFTWELARHPDTPLLTRSTVERTARVTAIDRRTVSWTGIPGNLDPTYVLNFAWDSTYAVYPAHLLKDIAPGDIAESTWAQQPRGYGPFKVTRYIPNEQLVLTRNPHYWRAPEGLPHVDTIIIKFLTSAEQLLAQLASGDIDVAGSIGLTLSQAEQLDDLQREGRIDVQYVPGSVWEHLDIGIRRGDGQPSFFDDVRVRQALAYGIDRQQLVDELLGGRTTVMHTVQPEGYWAYPPAESLNPYPYDPKQAGQLLDAAGWTVGVDGIRERAGQPFAITLHTTEGNATRRRVAQVIQEQLRQIGIVVELRIVPAETLFIESPDGILAGQRFDLALYAWQAGPEPSLYLYRCDEIPSEENEFYGQNYSGHCDAEYDQLVDQSNNQLERSARIPAIIAAEQRINRDLPVLPLYQDVLIVAYRRGVHGIALNPSTFVDFSFPEQLGITSSD